MSASQLPVWMEEHALIWSMATLVDVFLGTLAFTVRQVSKSKTHCAGNWPMLFLNKTSVLWTDYMHKMKTFFSLFLDIDECLSTPCLNGGTCTDMVNGYTCGCVPGYTGIHCETGWQKHLTYADTQTHFCLSFADFEGKYILCEEIRWLQLWLPFCFSFYFADIDECFSTPCLNGGTCTDMVNGYTCGCVPGYTGIHCETGEWKSFWFAVYWTYLVFLTRSNTCISKLIVCTVVLFSRHWWVPFNSLLEWWNMHWFGQWLHLWMCSWVHWNPLWDR